MLYILLSELTLSQMFLTMFKPSGIHKFAHCLSLGGRCCDLCALPSSVNDSGSRQNPMWQCDWYNSSGLFVLPAFYWSQLFLFFPLNYPHRVCYSGQSLFCSLSSSAHTTVSPPYMLCSSGGRDYILVFVHRPSPLVSVLVLVLRVNGAQYFIFSYLVMIKGLPVCSRPYVCVFCLVPPKWIGCAYDALPLDKTWWIAL